VVDAVLERTKNYFKENAVREEFVSVATVGTVAVIDRYLKTEIAAICDDFVACSVEISAMVDDAGRGSGFAVLGTVHGLKNAVKRVRDLAAKVVEREKTIDRPGIPQYLQTARGQQSVEAIESRRRAYIEEIVADAAAKQSSSSAAAAPAAADHTVRMTISVGSKFVVKLVVGDITEYKVDAIVNAANRSLDHAGGVARSIVDKGTKYGWKSIREFGVPKARVMKNFVLKLGPDTLPV